MSTLVLIPHQDDELFVLPRLRQRVAEGHRVVVLFLTDGGLLGHSPDRRDLESLRCLAAIGVAKEDLHFTHRKTGIADGSLAGSLRVVWPEVLSIIHQCAFRELLVPAWEGGHSDHDAAYLLGSALISRLPGVRADQFFMYNGANLPSLLFRVMSPLGGPAEITGHWVAYSAAAKTLTSVLRYPTQWRSLWPLVPGIAIRLLLHRREATQGVQENGAARPPHGGKLLYERLDRMSWNDFVLAARPFVEEHLPEVARSGYWTNHSR